MNDDLEKYIARRKRADKAFAKNFDAGYEEFKIGVMLRQAREQAGVTQEKLALITKTKKSAISRLENHAEDVRLSTVVRVARGICSVFHRAFYFTGLISAFQMKQSLGGCVSAAKY